MKFRDEQRRRGMQRAGEALRLSEAGVSGVGIGESLGLAAEWRGRPAGEKISASRVSQLVIRGRRLKKALGARIESYEAALAEVDPGHPAWHHLAHARSEWSMFQFHVAAEDLRRVAALVKELFTAPGGPS